MTKLLVTNIGTEIDLADASAHGIYVGENRLTYRDCDGDLRIYERRNGSLPTSAGDWHLKPNTSGLTPHLVQSFITSPAPEGER